VALADFFARNAVAVSQIVSGFDEETFTETVSDSVIAIAFGADAAQNDEGRHLLDMLVRLIARFYPTVTLMAGHGAESVASDLATLARAINPNIDLMSDVTPTSTIAVGVELPTIPDIARIVYAGCIGWDAYISEIEPKSVGASSNPFGAGAAAALACAKTFNLLFGEQEQRPLFSPDLILSTYDGETAPTQQPPSLDNLQLLESTVLVGLGAIGNAVIWALSRCDVAGSLYLVDHEDIELSNLQRYVLAVRSDDGRPKNEHLASHMSGRIQPLPHANNWAQFVSSHGYAWDQAIVALDSARDRRAVQSSLPGLIVNAWTQPGDIGISKHGHFGGSGACLSCLYLPTGVSAGEDVLVAEALRVPERVMEVRNLLYLRQPVPEELLALIAGRLGISGDDIARFRGVPIRKLYVEGLCGGALISLANSPMPRDLHVPVAHQSALAGILLAAAALRQRVRPNGDITMITRINVMNSVQGYFTQPARFDDRGLCICRDADYVSAYRAKYSR